MNSVPKLFSCSYADCWTEKHFSTEFGVLTPNHTHSHTLFWGCVSRWFGRALAWHARGHRFDPGNLHQKEKHCTGMCSAFLLCLPSYAATKFMLDICGKLWYNSFCNCGYSTSASISAFQAEEVGSIPITRSKRPEPWTVRVFSFCPALGSYLANRQRKCYNRAIKPLKGERYNGIPR